MTIKKNLCITGKVCTAQAHDYVNEEDDNDAFSDSRSVDLLAHNSVGWLRNVVRRNTQVAPEGKALGNGISKSYEKQVLYDRCFLYIRLYFTPYWQSSRGYRVVLSFSLGLSLIPQD